MAFCQNCGANVADNTEFCTSCGTKLGAAQPTTNARKLHCPQCKSHSISPINESSVPGGLTTHHGGVSSTHFSNQQRAFWMCADCGTKFRSIPSLEEEIKKSKSTPIVMTVFAILGFIITLYLTINTIGKPLSSFFFIPYIVGGATATILFFIFIFISRSKLKKMKTELEYLKVNCFN